MNIDEFLASRKPSVKTRGKLKAFRSEILQLRGAGYAVTEILDWLASENITTSAKSIYNILGSHKKETNDDRMNTAEKPTDSSPLLNKSNSPAPLLKPGVFLNKSERESIADKYVNPTSDNPVAKKILERKEAS